MIHSYDGEKREGAPDAGQLTLLRRKQCEGEGAGAGARPGFDVLRRGRGLGDTAALWAWNGGEGRSGWLPGAWVGARRRFESTSSTLATFPRAGCKSVRSVNWGSGRTLVVLSGMTSSGRTRQALAPALWAMG